MALDLADIQGLVLRGYQMLMVRHYLLMVRTPAEPATAWAARKWRRRRPAADHDRGGLARRLRTGTVGRSRRRPTLRARLLPQHRHHVAWTSGAGTRTTVPALSFKSFGAFVEGAANERAGRRRRGKLAGELGRRFRIWAGSHPGDAARHQPASDGPLQRSLARLVRRGGCLRRDVAARWDGIDGDGRWAGDAYDQGPLRIHRRHHDADHSRGPRIYPPDHQARASPGSSCCGKTQGATTYPSRERWA